MTGFCIFPHTIVCRHTALIELFVFQSDRQSQIPARAQPDADCNQKISHTDICCIHPQARFDALLLTHDPSGSRFEFILFQSDRMQLDGLAQQTCIAPLHPSPLSLPQDIVSEKAGGGVQAADPVTECRRVGCTPGLSKYHSKGWRTWPV